MKFSLALYEVEHLFMLFDHLNILSCEKLLKILSFAHIYIGFSLFDLFV